MFDIGESYGVNWEQALAEGFAFFGDGTGSPTPDGGATNTGQQSTPQTGFNNLVQRQGGVDAAALLLYQENHGYREKLRLAEQQLNELRGKLPAEGTVVLDADKAKLWEAYQGLGAPDEVKKVKDEYAGLKREAHFRAVAEVHGFNPVVLAGLPGAAALTIEIGEETVNGKTAKVAYVVQQDGKKIALPDYAKQTWEPFLPALHAAAGTGQQAQSKGTPFIRQQTGAGAKSADKVQERLEARRKAAEQQKNPLMS